MSVKLWKLQHFCQQQKVSFQISAPWLLILELLDTNFGPRFLNFYLAKTALLLEFKFSLRCISNKGF